VWGGVAFSLAFDAMPSNAPQWIALWPVWLDFQLRSQISTAFWNPILEPSIIGAAGACAVVYILLTFSHIRE